VRVNNNRVSLTHELRYIVVSSVYNYINMNLTYLPRELLCEIMSKLQFRGMSKFVCTSKVLSKLHEDFVDMWI
jgi:hypothetical protein